MNAAKDRMAPDDALALAARHHKVVVARGKKTLTFDMKKDPPGDDELLDVIIGRSGWLRAPAWTRGKTLVVGFNEDAYDDLLG